MTELVTATQMRAHEAAVFASGVLTPAQAMESAGLGLAWAVGALWQARQGAGAAPGRVAVLCGPGNNGGDGFVAARHLQKAGWSVRVLGWRDGAGAARGPAAQMRALWSAQGAILPPSPDALGRPDLVIDALLGIGLTRPFRPDPPLAGTLERIKTLRAEGALAVVAADIPSGLCADSGSVPGEALMADLTVSFGRAKAGQYLGQGPRVCGRLQIVPAGLDGPLQGLPEGAMAARLAAAPTGARLAKPVWRDAADADGRGTHKFDHGHVLVLAGGAIEQGSGGAARLAARAALRIGAGLVTLGCPAAAVPEHAAALDAVMLRALDTPQALAAQLADQRISALCVGPGLGLSRARAMVPVALAAGRGVVLDADALSAFAQTPEALFQALHPGVVLTPHGGEFARLFPDLAAAMFPRPGELPRLSRIAAVTKAAARAGAVVLLKGPDTVIATPDGAAVVHVAAYGRAAPWLATAGAGDVLAGMIAGLMARRWAPAEAAEAAVWLHAEAARAFGPGLIAEDLPRMLPAVMRALIPANQDDGVVDCPGPSAAP